MWQSYLESIGTPEKEVHSIARRLEHFDQAQVSAYLDKKLGSPKTGPMEKRSQQKYPGGREKMK